MRCPGTRDGRGAGPHGLRFVGARVKPALMATWALGLGGYFVGGHARGAPTRPHQLAGGRGNSSTKGKASSIFKPGPACGGSMDFQSCSPALGGVNLPFS
jgi:hypothetical protein